MGAVRFGDHLELLDVEAQVVEPAHLLLHLVALGAVDHHRLRQLRPQPAVPTQHSLRGVLGVDALVQQPAGRQVE